jgi:hypothetical protein
MSAPKVGTWSYFIQYVQESTHQPEKTAGYFLTGTLAAFGVGRFASAYLMRFIAPNRLMGAYSVANILLVSLGVLLPNWVGLWCVFLTSFFMSLMFSHHLRAWIERAGPEHQDWRVPACDGDRRRRGFDAADGARLGTGSGHRVGLLRSARLLRIYRFVFVFRLQTAASTRNLKAGGISHEESEPGRRKSRKGRVYCLVSFTPDWARRRATRWRHC